MAPEVLESRMNLENVEVLQADGCLLHGPGALGDDVPLQRRGGRRGSPSGAPSNDVVLIASALSSGIQKSCLRSGRTQIFQHDVESLNCAKKALVL